MAQLKVSLENIIPLTEARDHFSQIVAEVQRDKLYVLTKGGKPAVAIIDVRYLESITGGAINTGHIEKEIQKDPSKVGRTPMIKISGNQDHNAPISSPKPAPDPTPTPNPTNIPKAFINPPNEVKPNLPNTPPMKINFEPAAKSPIPAPTNNMPPISPNSASSFKPNPVTSPASTFSTPSSIPQVPLNPTSTPFSQPKPFIPSSFSPNPIATPTAIPVQPTATPTAMPVQSAVTPATTPVQPPVTAAPISTPPLGATNTFGMPPSVRPMPAPLASPSNPAPMTNPTPMANPTPPMYSAAAQQNPASSISVSTPTPMSSTPPQPVNSPITWQPAPTAVNNNPTPPPPTNISSGSGLSMQSTIPSNNSGASIDVIPAPEDMNLIKPNPAPAYPDNKPKPLPATAHSSQGEPDDMVLD